MKNNGKLLDETNKTHGSLYVLGPGRPSSKGRYWRCRCLKCGKEKEVRGDHLRSGDTVGCSPGCTMTTHGQSGAHRTKEYRTWDHIIQRCSNPNTDSHDNYGGRGIVVCDRWRQSFQAFFEDMGRCPDDCDGGIDRIKNDRGYEPGNCRWATKKQQDRNKRSNRLITIDGTTKTLVEWLEETGVKRLTFYKRTWAGWTEEEALFGRKR